jgi:predicted DNA-binding ribbon-helix-helix protein
MTTKRSKTKRSVRDPVRTFRISNKEWAAWHKFARKRKTTISGLIRELVQREMESGAAAKER